MHAVVLSKHQGIIHDQQNQSFPWLQFGPRGAPARHSPARYNPILVCLLARDIRGTGQGHLTVDGGGPEIVTRGLWLCQLGLTLRESALACLASGLALTKKTRTRAHAPTRPEEPHPGCFCFKGSPPCPASPSATQDFPSAGGLIGRTQTQALPRLYFNMKMAFHYSYH